MNDREKRLDRAHRTLMAAMADVDDAQSGNEYDYVLAAMAEARGLLESIAPVPDRRPELADRIDAMEERVCEKLDGAPDAPSDAPEGDE